MQFHPKALAAFAAFLLIVVLAVDHRLTVAGAAAGVAIELLLWVGLIALRRA